MSAMAVKHKRKRPNRAALLAAAATAPAAPPAALLGHKGRCFDCCVHPGTKLLATAAEDGGVRVWRPSPTGWSGSRELRGHSDEEVLRVAWSQDAAAPVLASGGADGGVRLWRSGDGWAGGGAVSATSVVLKEAPEKGVEPDQVYGLAWAAHGAGNGGGLTLAAAAHDAVLYYDAATGAGCGRLGFQRAEDGLVHGGEERNAGGAAYVFDVRLSSTGALLAAALSDGTARVADTRSGAPVAVLAGGNGPVTACRWALDDSDLVLCDGRGGLHVWDARMWESRLALDGGHRGACYGCAFSPAVPGALVSWSSDGTVAAWDVGPGGAAVAAADDGYDEERAPLATGRPHGEAFPLLTACFAPDGTLVLGGGGGGENAFIGTPLYVVPTRGVGAAAAAAAVGEAGAAAAGAGSPKSPKV